MRLDIESDASIGLTNKLERLHRSAFPVAVRSALNSAAFDVKKTTMLKEAKSEFEERSKDFFKGNSRVEMAKGFDVDHMESTVGFLAKGNQAVEDLEQQDRGGIIKGRTFIPLDNIRESRSYSNKVQVKYRYSRIKKFKRASRQKGKNKGENTIIAAFKVGRGGYILGYNDIVYRVDGLIKSKNRIKLTPAYKFNKGKKVKVQKTEFMQRASIISGKKLERFYAVEANKQFKKHGLK